MRKQRPIFKLYNRIKTKFYNKLDCNFHLTFEKVKINTVIKLDKFHKHFFVSTLHVVPSMLYAFLK